MIEEKRILELLADTQIEAETRTARRVASNGDETRYRALVLLERSGYKLMFAQRVLLEARGKVDISDSAGLLQLAQHLKSDG